MVRTHTHTLLTTQQVHYAGEWLHLVKGFFQGVEYYQMAINSLEEMEIFVVWKAFYGLLQFMFKDWILLVNIKGVVLLFPYTKL